MSEKKYILDILISAFYEIFSFLIAVKRTITDQIMLVSQITQVIL